MNCPSCSWELEPRRSAEVEHHVCPLCAGLLVPTLKSMALFRAWENEDVEDPVGLPPDLPEATACPQCSGALEAFGYMGSQVATARCNACRLLWVPGTLRNPVRNLWRKAQGRAEKRLAKEEAAASREWQDAQGPRKHGRRRGFDAAKRAEIHRLRAWETHSKRFRDED